MPDLVPELSWQSLTATIIDIKSPNTFLQDMLIGGRRNTHPTEQLEVGKWLGGRRMVPFVKKGAQAYPIAGVTSSFRSVEAPNIRVKIGFAPSPLLFGRQPGTQVFLQGGETQVSAVQSHISRDMAYMADQITNREEWLVAQALTGKITYSQTDDLHAEAFEFDYQRAAGHTIVLAGADLWSAGTADIAGDVDSADQLIAEAVGANVTDVIMDALAADAFLNNSKVQSIVDRNFREAGSPLQFGSRNDPSTGARWLGNIFGVDWWRYNRTVLDADGTTVKMIPDKTAFFVARSAAVAPSIEYGAIPDMDAFEGGLLQSQRFSKSWVEKDPSQVVALTHTRPFVLLRYPEFCVQMQVLA